MERCVRIIEKPTSQGGNARPSPVRSAGDPGPRRLALAAGCPARQTCLGNPVIRRVSVEYRT